MKSLISIAFLLILTNISIAQKLTKQDWTEDIDYLKEELPQKHYDLFHLKSRDYFNNEIEKLKSQLTEFDDLTIAIKLKQIIAKMGDTHTDIDISSFLEKSEFLPLNLYWFSDGLYILNTIENHKELLGKRIEKINDFPVNVIADSLSTLFYPENQALIKKNIPNYIVNITLLKYFEFANNDPVNVEVSEGAGSLTEKITPKKIPEENVVSYKTKAVVEFRKYQRRLFYDYYLPQSKTYIIGYNKCFSKENPPPGIKNAVRLPSFKSFENKVIQTIQQNEIDKFVFDLRLNTGGNSVQGTDLIEKLTKIKTLNQKGKLFVIIGRYTFSSAIINAMDFKKRTEAIFVGEETSGRPNHFGEVRTFDLPNSKVKVYYSTKYFKKYDLEDPTLKPDIYVDERFKDYVKGADPVLQAILDYK